MLGLLFFLLFLAALCFFGFVAMGAGVWMLAGVWDWWKTPDVSSGAAVANGILRAALADDHSRAAAIFQRLPNWPITAQLRQTFLWHTAYHRTLLQAVPLLDAAQLRGMVVESTRLFHGWANLAGRITVISDSVGGIEKELNGPSRQQLESRRSEMAAACPQLQAMIEQVQQMLATEGYGVDLRWQFAQLKAWNHTLGGMQ